MPAVVGFAGESVDPVVVGKLNVGAVRVRAGSFIDVDVVAFIGGINVDANVDFDDRCATSEFVVVFLIANAVVVPVVGCDFVGSVDVGNI